MNYYYRTNQGNYLLYGKNSIKGSSAINSILKVFNKQDDKELFLRLEYMIKFVYKGGLLLHSIFELELPGEEERKYNSEFGLYISLRSLSLMTILENSSILLEFYRDDIDTYITNYDKISTEMTFFGKIIYILEYIERLFEIEKTYINMALSNLDDYRKMFGSTYLVCPLLQGVIKSSKNYYSKMNSEYVLISEKVKLLINLMDSYTEEIEQKGEKAICIETKLRKSYNSLNII